MTDLEKAARQALDALENLGKHTSERECDEAIDALRAALSQQQAEPDAVLAEREACARLCENNHDMIADSLDGYEMAAAIRARGKE
jgi:hypothetical protein